MRVLAVLFALLLVAVPFVACGGGSSTSCVGICGDCHNNTDCCGSALCRITTSDGFPRCETADHQCKLGN